MNTIKRYTQAFITALKMTLAGKAIQPVALRYPNLTKWISEGLQLVDAAFRTADAQGMSATARQQFMLKIDHRDMSMDVILRAVKHNLSLEYPMLMKSTTEHNLTTLYAMNMNDQYRVRLLAEAHDLPPDIQAAVARLSAHLQNIPSSNQP
jgi:hypothetical protein